MAVLRNILKLKSGIGILVRIQLNLENTKNIPCKYKSPIINRKRVFARKG